MPIALPLEIWTHHSNLLSVCPWVVSPFSIEPLSIPTISSSTLTANPIISLIRQESEINWKKSTAHWTLGFLTQSPHAPYLEAASISSPQVTSLNYWSCVVWQVALAESPHTAWCLRPEDFPPDRNCDWFPNNCRGSNADALNPTPAPCSDIISLHLYIPRSLWNLDPSTWGISDTCWGESKARLLGTFFFPRTTGSCFPLSYLWIDNGELWSSSLTFSREYSTRACCGASPISSRLTKCSNDRLVYRVDGDAIAPSRIGQPFPFGNYSFWVSLVLFARSSANGLRVIAMYPNILGMTMALVTRCVRGIGRGGICCPNLVVHLLRTSIIDM